MCIHQSKTLNAGKTMIVQAIETKYLGPTNTLGSRIKAKAKAESLTIPYSYELEPDVNHKLAAMALIRKLEWDRHGTWHQGGNAKGDGYVFVCEVNTSK